MRALNALTALAIIAASPSALALAAGQGGASGRPNGGLCNRCHGTQTYQGLELVLAQGTRKECYAPNVDGSAFQVADVHYILPLSQPNAPSRTTLSIVATAPPEAQFKAEECTVGFRAPDPADPNRDTCPPNQTCCSTEGDVCSGGFCIEGDSLFCPQDSTCGAPVAGFNIEVVGQGALEASDPGSRGIETTAEGNGQFGQLTHNAPKAFAGGAVQWDVVYQAPEAPAIGNGPQSATLYAAVNACNANGVQDAGDITALADIDIYFSQADPTTGQVVSAAPDCLEAPDCTAVEGSQGLNLTNLSCCPDGQIDDGGACVAEGGCAHLSVPGSAASGGFVALLVLGGLLLRRRRRD